jgi:hypothetical protein
MSDSDTCRGRTKGDKKIITSERNKGASFPHMAFKYGGAKEKEWKMEGLRRFHQFELGLS